MTKTALHDISCRAVFLCFDRVFFVVEDHIAAGVVNHGLSVFRPLRDVYAVSPVYMPVKKEAGTELFQQPVEAVMVRFRL